MCSLLHIYLVICCIALNIRSSISTPSKDRSSSKIKLNSWVDASDGDLFQYMANIFSPNINFKSSSAPIKSSSSSKMEENRQHHREKRFIWITKEKRIVLPPGTQLVLTPTLGKTVLAFVLGRIIYESIMNTYF